MLIRADDGEKGMIRFHQVNEDDDQDIRLEQGTAGGFNIMNKTTDKDITIQCNDGGTNITHVKFDAGDRRTEFNPDQEADYDFRISTDCCENFIYIDGTDNVLGVAAGAPGGDLPTNARMTIGKGATAGAVTELLILKESDGDSSENLTTGNGAALLFHVAENAGSALGARIIAQRESNTDTNTQAGLGFWTYADNASGAERMRIDYTGRVGIGTTTPVHKLQVVGTISGSSTLEVVGNTFIGGTLSVSGTVSHGGASTFTTISASSTLEVVGATVLGRSLAVTGAAALDSTTRG